MTYIVKWTDGRTSEHTLRELRDGFRAGEFSGFCTVGSADSNEVSSIEEFLKSTSSLPDDEPPAPTTGIDPGVSQRAARRYRDAYRVARVIDGIGGIVKTVGMVFGVLVAVAVVLLGSEREGGTLLILGGVVAGAIIAIPIYVLGVLVSAQGQLLKASLDEAVHTSPFLSLEEKASALSLR